MLHEQRLGDLEDMYLRGDYDRVLRRTGGSKTGRDLLQLLVIVAREISELRKNLHEIAQSEREPDRG